MYSQFMSWELTTLFISSLTVQEKSIRGKEEAFPPHRLLCPLVFFPSFFFKASASYAVDSQCIKSWFYFSWDRNVRFNISQRKAWLARQISFRARSNGTFQNQMVMIWGSSTGLGSLTSFSTANTRWLWVPYNPLQQMQNSQPPPKV